MYIWYSYAAFEELDAKNFEKANEVYSRALQIVPHKKFTMTKLWIMYANFALRCQDLDKMRKIYGIALGKCPNEKII